MGDSAAPLLHPGLGFEGDCDQKSMEIEGVVSAAALVPELPPPSPALGDDDDEESSTPTTVDDEDEWLVSGSEEEDQEDEGTYSPFTVVNIPRPSCDHKQQGHICYANPEVRRRGPLPIWHFPAFKSGNHVFGYYNLANTSPIVVNNVGDCQNECNCVPVCLLQFIDIKIAGYTHTHPGRAKIYGFIAARELTDPLRNYVYRRSIDNCEAVSVKRKTGVARLSLTSPSRVISITSRTLIEFELHVPNEDNANGVDDLITEGCTELESMFRSESFIDHRRVYGEKCSLDIKYMVLINAVEARVEVTVLRLSAIAGGVNMNVYAKTSGYTEVIRLFRGAAPKPGVTICFSVAVKTHSGFDLYIEGCQRDGSAPGKELLLPCSWWESGFASGYHGTSEEVAELGVFGAVSVKVNWRSYMKKP